jgi:putative polyketide hydroxylase
MGMNTAVAEAHDLGWKLAWVLDGWAGTGLLDTYEAEWRPVGARRVARSALEGWEPPGQEALAEDLNGRLGHAWLAQANGHRRSTLDLLGRGLTLLTGPGACARAWTDAGATLGTAFPLDVRPVDAGAAATLGIRPDGAVLARPDAQVVAHWPTTPPDPRAELAAASSGWVEGGLVSSGAGTGRWRRGRRP